MSVLLVFAVMTVTDSPPLVLISIDGLKPDYVIEADKYNLKIPNLRKIKSEGVYAAGVKGVLPTVTYPSHATIITGVSPDKHKIMFNRPFDPYNQNDWGWYWFAEDIQAPTLWSEAVKAGLIVSNIDWPTTVGANITINIPQYWGVSTPDRDKILRSLSTNEVIKEAENALGVKYPYSDHSSIKGDLLKALFSVYILKTKQPDFHLCYFTGLDTEQHRTGPYSSETFSTLEKIDELIGQITAIANEYSDNKAIICVVSDHGFTEYNKVININSALVSAGLIKFNEDYEIVDWNAMAWSCDGGSAAIFIKEGDLKASDQVKSVLEEITKSDNCIEQIIEDKENDIILV